MSSPRSGPCSCLFPGLGLPLLPGPSSNTFLIVSPYLPKRREGSSTSKIVGRGPPSTTTDCTVRFLKPVKKTSRSVFCYKKKKCSRLEGVRRRRNSPTFGIFCLSFTTQSDSARTGATHNPVSRGASGVSHYGREPR